MPTMAAVMCCMAYRSDGPRRGGRVCCLGETAPAKPRRCARSWVWCHTGRSHPVRAARTSSGLPSASIAQSWHRAGAGGSSRIRQAQRAGEPGARRKAPADGNRSGVWDLERCVCAVSGAAQRFEPQVRHAFRRGAADADDRPNSDGQSDVALARRAGGRPCARHCRRACRRLGDLAAAGTVDADFGAEPHASRAPLPTGPM